MVELGHRHRQRLILSPEHVTELLHLLENLAQMVELGHRHRQRLILSPEHVTELLHLLENRP